MIRFNKPAYIGKEIEYITDAVTSGHLSGDNKYTKLCQQWLEQRCGCTKALITPSGTASLEMAAILAGIQPGDEVIMPSYTFVSTANAFLLRGAKIVFVDIRPDTLNIDENLIRAAISDKARAIVPVHYAGVSCAMDEINSLAREHELFVIEDAAQGLMSRYKNKALGTLGDFAAFSFHETKNYNSGEGGAIFVNHDDFIERSEIIREKGTNRSKFFRGEVDKYTWVDIGSSYLLSELGAAYLYAQLESADSINDNRMATWNRYYQALQPLADAGHITLPGIPDNCTHNAHLFYLLASSEKEQAELLAHLKSHEIGAVFHYIPLHSSPMGKNTCRFHGEDLYTTSLSKRIIRLPLYYNISTSDVENVIDSVNEFYR